MLQLSVIARLGWIARPLTYAYDEVTAWWQASGMWWAVSVSAHALVLSTVLLLMGNFSRPIADVPARVYSFDTTIAPPTDVPLEMSPAEAPSVEIQNDFRDVEVATPATIDLQPSAIDVNEAFDGDPAFGDDRSPSLEGITILSALRESKDKSGVLLPTGPRHGNAPTGEPVGSLGDRQGRMGPGGGGRGGTGRTKQGDRAVAAALAWLARHQDADGRWSLANFSRQCRDGRCACKAGASDTAATALALLPFLATGETHRTKGKYRQTLSRGLYWLTSQQKSDGDLRSGSGTMYAHGLATIALCEAYGMSDDQQLGAGASRAIQFILSAQDPVGGGWRYEPRQSGDLSVVGWQLMALKSGQMAGLSVPSEAFERAAKFVKSVGDGQGGFGYTDPGRATVMSAVGLLCTQYLGAGRNDPTLRGGSQILLANLPTSESRNTYYWYYATQVMHNLNGSEWDTWNRRMRKVLIETQETQGCAAGSWSPDGHPHAEQGGRLMVTSLNTLSLEVYYRYLPLYKIGR